MVVYLDAGGGGVFLLFVLLSLHKPVTLLAQAGSQESNDEMYVCVYTDVSNVPVVAIYFVVVSFVVFLYESASASHG